MNKLHIGSFLLAFSMCSAAQAEAPGSYAAGECFLAMSNTAIYEVWPGVLAEKVGRFVHTTRSNHIYSRDTNEITALCYSADWHLKKLPDGTPANFRASPYPFAGGTPVHRFRHKTTGHYFYTASQSEYLNTLTNGAATWTDEGIAFYVPVVQIQTVTLVDGATGNTYRATNLPTTCENPLYRTGIARPAVCRSTAPAKSTGLTPVYRFYSPTYGHYYTANRSEAQSMLDNSPGNTYSYERVAFWAFDVDALGRTTPIDLPAEITGVYYRIGASN